MRLKSLLFASLLAGTAVTGAATATPLTVEFEMAASAGTPLDGTFEQGSFSFDDSIIPAGGTGSLFVNAGLPLLSFHFHWDGIDYDLGNAGVYFLKFAGGIITGIGMGSASGGLSGAIQNTSDWGIFTESVDETYARYNVAGIDQTWRGTAQFWPTDVIQVPKDAVASEPAAIGILVLGLAALVLRRRAA